MTFDVRYAAFLVVAIAAGIAAVLGFRQPRSTPRRLRWFATSSFGGTAIGSLLAARYGLATGIVVALCVTVVLLLGFWLEAIRESHAADER